jgi:hypothetical protein
MHALSLCFPIPFRVGRVNSWNWNCSGVSILSGHWRCPQSKFLPVRISQCEIPNIFIKDDTHLRDLQWIDYFAEPDLAIFRLLQQIIHTEGDNAIIDQLLRPGLENHLERKISMLSQLEAPLTIEARAEAFALLSPRVWFASLDMIHRSIKSFTKLSSISTNRWQDPQPGGPVVSVTIAANRDYSDILEHLPQASGTKSPYIEYIRSDLEFLHGLSKWETRSYAHWIIKLDSDGTSADLFFWPSFRCRYHDLINNHLAMQAKLEVRFMGTIVPGSLVGEADIGAFLAQRMEADLLMWNPDLEA